MLFITIKFRIFLVLILFFGLLLVGCNHQGRAGSTGNSPITSIHPRLSIEHIDETGLAGIQSLVVFPAQFEVQARAAATHAENIDQRLLDAAESELRIKLVAGQLDQSQRENTSAVGSRHEKFVQYARQKGYDGVLLTHILRYAEREGSKIGVSSPAQLSFSLQLFRSSDAREVWRAHYRFKDQALSENWLQAEDRFANHQDGAGWQDVNTVMRRGFFESFAKLESMRAQAFTKGL